MAAADPNSIPQARRTAGMGTFIIKAVTATT